MIKTYNIELKFQNIEDEQYWFDLLNQSISVYNDISDLIWNNSKMVLNLKTVHDLVYTKMRTKYPSIPAQSIIKIYKLVMANYRANKRKFKCIKDTPSMMLDKRLYSKLTGISINLTSNQSTKTHKRCTVDFALYDKFIEMAAKYIMKDPTVFIRNGKIYLAVPFEVPETPVLSNTCLGVDLGVRRFYTTSDGVAIKTTKLNKIKRKIRYLKRILNSKKHNGNGSARIKFKKLRHKERNINKEWSHLMANNLLNTDKNVIVLEDLTNLKQSTSRFENGHKRTKHNNRVSQVPLYMFKQILSYKAPLLGKKVVTVSPAYTSQINCLTGKKEGIRHGCRFYCPNGMVLDADWNAALNIAKRSKLPTSISVPIDGTLILL